MGRGSFSTARRRKAPVALFSFRSVLLAVFVAALLTALTAAASPFVTTAVGSEALDNRLQELSQYATGLQIQGPLPGVGLGLSGGRPTVAQLVHVEAVHESAAKQLAANLDSVGAPVLTDESGVLFAHAPGGDVELRLMARTDALAHVKVLSQTSGPGIFVADTTTKAGGLKLGGRLSFSTPSGGSFSLRIKGVYRALSESPESNYWTNLDQDIYPATPDDQTPPPYVLGAPRIVLVALTKLGLSGTGSAVGGSSSLFSGSMFEFPVDPHGLTLSRARQLERRFDATARVLNSSALGQKLGCSREFEGCRTLTSLSAAVLLADRNAAAVKVPVSLLADAGTAIALAVAAAAGAFLVRRRRGEAALAYARGEHVAAFATRTAVEALMPMLLGGAAGFGLAYAIIGLFAPSGSTDGPTVDAALLHAAVTTGIALVLLVGAASIAFLRLFDTGARGVTWIRFVPWELALIGVATYLLVRITSGGGLGGDTSTGAAHPTLAVFVFPLLLVAGAAGLAARLFRVGLRLVSARAARVRSIPLYLAVRRLTAARGLLVVLAVVTATALGAFCYAESLATSLGHTTTEKAYMATGSDAQVFVPDEPITRSFPYPITRVEFSNQNAALDTADGVQADVMLVDPATVVGAMHWESDWGTNPGKLVAQLASSPSRPLPVIVTSNAAGLRTLWASGVPFPVRVLGSVKAFPEEAQGIPLVITSYQAMRDASARLKVEDPLGVLQSYVWGKGPPAAVERALTSASIDAYYPTSIETFLRDPNVLLATRTYSFMRTIAIAAAVLVLLGLLLYLQARQRSQVIASALARRMGLGARGEALSVSLEVLAILAFAAVIGGGIAIASVGPVVRHIDPLPLDAPSPIFALPSGAILVAAASLIVVAGLAGAVTTWLAGRADVSEELRVA